MVVTVVAAVVPGIKPSTLAGTNARMIGMTTITAKTTATMTKPRVMRFSWEKIFFIGKRVARMATNI